MGESIKTSHFKLCDDQPLQATGAVGFYLDGIGDEAQTPVTFMSLGVWETLGRPAQMSFQSQVVVPE